MIWTQTLKRIQMPLITNIQDIDFSRLFWDRLEQTKTSVAISDSSPINDSIPINNGSRIVDLGYYLKSDSYDGTTPLWEFLNQFKYTEKANKRNSSTKYIAVTASLTEKARSVIIDFDNNIWHYGFW